MSYEIQMNEAAATSQVINHLSTGIPKEMALRELVINGIEACGRNPAEAAEHSVLVVKDHQHRNKLSVINTGGDFLSQEVFKNNLATLGKTGNLVGKDYILDDNKGIGAKISYLPKARLGLLYRSVEKDEQEGIFAQMCDNGDGIYHLPAFECEYTGEQTVWPICDSFSEYRNNSTTTEVVAMGDNIHQDTWLDFDQTCSVRKAITDGGTGYGVFRYLTHRLWTQPQAPVRVGIYEKSTGDLKRLAKVNGLKSFMMKTGCKQYGTVNFKYNGKIDIVAHWSIIKDAKDPGYSSNWSASGYTGIAWKGEVYSDFKQHHLSVKKDLNDCGVIIKYNKVLVVFEIGDDVQLKTNSGRTELFDGDAKIDKALLHNLFRENFPQKLREWQEENQLKDENSEDLTKQIAKYMQELGFGSSKKGTSTSQSPLKVVRAPNQKNGSALKSPAAKSKSMKKINSATNLRNYKPIPHREITDENAPLIEFHYRDYVLLLNTGSSVYENRKERILNKLGESCLVKSTLESQIKMMTIVNAMFVIFETSNNYADSTLEERREKWLPQILEANWNLPTEKEILRIIKRKNGEQKKAA